MRLLVQYMQHTFSQTEEDLKFFLNSENSLCGSRIGLKIFFTLRRYFISFNTGEFTLIYITDLESYEFTSRIRHYLILHVEPGSFISPSLNDVLQQCFFELHNNRKCQIFTIFTVSVRFTSFIGIGCSMVETRTPTSPSLFDLKNTNPFEKDKIIGT
jgi:hypothetical protein